MTSYVRKRLAFLYAFSITATADALVQQPVDLTRPKEVTEIKPADYYRQSQEARHLIRARKYDQAIAPDIPVELSSADYFGNRDPVLDAVLEIIKRGALLKQ